jgi:two-component system, LytTR family, sensor kinase
MKFSWRYIFPILFGITIYTSIRLVNDTTAHEKFWERPWQTNAVEITGVVLVSFIIHWAINSLIKYFRRSEPKQIIPKIVLKEFGLALLVILFIIHTTIIPLIAFTDDGLQLNDYVIANIIPTLFVLLYFAIVRGNEYLKNYVNQKVQLEKITTDQLQTELKFLKAQYHPHFLFNALNTVYFQMDENVAEAKKTVEKFSELLRYQLYDQHHTVPISQEIHYLKNFIDIQKIRTSEKLRLETHFDETLNELHVYPLLFLPLVENAFKYVGGDYHIHIIAKVNGDKIHFSVNNSLPHHIVLEKQNGIGLENLRRKLELLYAGKYSLEAERIGNEFKAALTLTISPHFSHEH